MMLWTSDFGEAIGIRFVLWWHLLDLRSSDAVVIGEKKAGGKQTIAIHCSTGLGSADNSACSTPPLSRRAMPRLFRDTNVDATTNKAEAAG